LYRTLIKAVIYLCISAFETLAQKDEE